MFKPLLSLLLGVVFIMLSGCSGLSVKELRENSYTEKPENSMALNLVNASGINHQGFLEDVPKEKVQEALKAGGRSSDASLHIASSALFATGTATALTGMSSLGSAGFGLIPALIPTAPLTYRKTRWVIWMPKNNMTKEEAKKEIERLLTISIKKSYPNYDIYRWNGLATPETEQHFRVRVTEPVDAKAPSWLGGYDAYGWGIAKEDTIFEFPKEVLIFLPKKFYDDFHKDKCATSYHQEISKIIKDLPKWIYFYAPTSPRKDENYPVVLNQGKALLFIEPAKHRLAGTATKQL